jgi:hypothetical protein
VALLLFATLLSGCSGKRAPATLDPQHLPPLPSQVLAVQRGPDVVLVRLDGSEIGRLAGYRAHPFGYLERGNRPVRLAPGRVRPIPSGGTGYGDVFTGKTTNVAGSVLDCELKLARLASSRIVACIRSRRAGPGMLGLQTPDGRVRPLVPPPRGVRDGFWGTAFVSPDRKRLLLEWGGGCQTASGECRTTETECEVSTVYLAPAAGGEPVRVTRDPSADAYALGWTDDGRPLVDLPADVCGRRAGKPAVYAVGTGMRLEPIARGSYAALLRP